MRTMPGKSSTCWERSRPYTAAVRWAGGEVTPIQSTTVAASYFHYYISDLICAKSGIPIPGLLHTLTERQNAGKAEVGGIEVKLRQKLYWDWLHLYAERFDHHRKYRQPADRRQTNGAITENHV